MCIHPHHYQVLGCPLEVQFSVAGLVFSPYFIVTLLVVNLNVATEAVFSRSVVPTPSWNVTDQLFQAHNQITHEDWKVVTGMEGSATVGMELASPTNRIWLAYQRLMAPP